MKNIAIMRAIENSQNARRATANDVKALRERRACWLLVLLCVLAYTPNIIATLGGALPFGEDTSALFGPWREYSRHALSEGILPLWNARVFCGLPFMPNAQTSVLYFFNFVYWFFPLPLAFLLDAVGHNILLALGAYTLARALGQSRGAALLAAGALGLGGAVSAHANAGHTTWHAARAYIPWELWALLMYLREQDSSRRNGFLLALALFFSLQIFAGYPPLVLLGVGLCCGLFLAFAAGTRRLQLRWLRDAGLVGGGIFLLSAAAILPLREVSRLSAHGAGLEYEIASVGSGTERSVFRLLSPDFFGGNTALQWSTSVGAWEEAAYGGVLVFVLALGAPFFAAVRGANGWKLPRAVPWLFALLPLSLLLALGDNTPLYRFLFDHVSLFRLTRVPVRWLEVWALCAALLAGFSFDALWRRTKRTSREFSQDDSTSRPPDGAQVLALRFRWLQGALCGVVALMICAAIFAALQSPTGQAWMRTAQQATHHTSLGEIGAAASEMRTRAIIEPLITCLIAGLLCLYATRTRARQLLLAIAVADVMFAFWKSAQPLPKSYLQNTVRWPAELTQRATPDERWASDISFGASNNNLLSGPDVVDGYDALSGAVHTDFISALEGRKLWVAAYGPSRPNPLLRVAGVTHLVAQRTPEVQWNNRTLLQPEARVGDWRLWRYNWKSWPREYLTTQVLAVPREQQLSRLQFLCETAESGADLPVVAAPGDFPSFETNPASSNARVLAVRRGWNRTSLRIQTDTPAILVQADTLYPGWRAFIDGNSATIAPANYLFRGVQVAPESSRVEFVYDSQTFRIGVFLSLCGLGALIALMCGAQRRLFMPLRH